jgi:hypothetical protein
MMMMPISLVFVFYALRTYLHRLDKIMYRDNERWDDPFGPVLLASFFTLALVVEFVIKVRTAFGS